MDDDDEGEMYIQQLHEVFDSCDLTGCGALDRDGLLLLCNKLQLDDQAHLIIAGLLGEEQTGQLDFEEFKDLFLNILCQTVVENPQGREDEVEDEEEQEEEEEDMEEEEDVEDPTPRINMNEDTSVIHHEVMPKYIKGNKIYGRRSRPITSDEFDSVTSQSGDEKKSSEPVPSVPRQKQKSRPFQGSISSSAEESDVQSPTKRKRKNDSQHSSSESDNKETFEAEGQLNLIMGEMEKTVDMQSEEDYLRAIWDQLGVGKQGFITLLELGQVCNHIGMEEMNDIELKQLFEKLDADQDNLVSFDEFLVGLSQHSGTATSSISSNQATPSQQSGAITPSQLGTPTATVGGARALGTPTQRAFSAQKKLKFPSANDERITPSLVPGSGTSGLFSLLDPEHTGFAKPDAIIDLWEKYNIHHGTDVLLALGIDLNTKVNLADLSYALEQELLNAEEQSLVYQASLASYQQELRHLKASLEQQLWASEKLKLDLSEANARNSLLVKEVDERHAHMEKSTETKLFSVEKKYQEQIKNLQLELDGERDMFTKEAARQKQKADAQMEELKQEEARLREQVFQAQKELEKMNKDLDVTTDKLEEANKQNLHLQRELEAVDDLHRKLAEYESKGVLNPAEHKFTQEKIERLEQENKDLKDHNDELTVELENLKQQTSPARKPPTNHPSSPDLSHTPAREGSVLSDYIKPYIRKWRSISSGDNSDDDSKLGSPVLYRKLQNQAAPEEDSINKMQAAKGVYYPKFLPGVSSIGERDIQIEMLKKELQDLKNLFELEQKDIEQAARLEITEAEERLDREKADILRNFEKEKASMIDDFEKLQQEALAELCKELQTKFVIEKEDLIERYESEKNLREQKFAEEKQRLVERLQQEYEEDVRNQIKDLEAKYEKDMFELEELLTEQKTTTKELKRQKVELEQRLAEQQRDAEQQILLQKRDLEQQLQLQHQDTEQRAEMTKHEVEQKLELQRQEMELEFSKERQVLEDLFNQKVQEMSEEHCGEIEEYEKIFSKGIGALRGKLYDDFYSLLEKHKEEVMQREREEMQKSMGRETTQFEESLETMKAKLCRTFEEERSELIALHEVKVEALRQQLAEAEQKMEEEREALAQRFEAEREELEEEIAKQIREEVEEEILQQMEEVKVAFEEERHEFEAQVQLLKEEVQDLQEALDTENKNRMRAEDLNKTISRLQQEKRQLERSHEEMHEALGSTKRALELRIEELSQEKEGAIIAVKSEHLQSAQESSKEQTGNDAVVLEKEALQSQVSRLNQELVETNKQLEQAQQKQASIDNLKAENESLRDEIEALRLKLSQVKSSIPEHAKRVIDELTQEKSKLKQSLQQAENSQAEVNELKQKLTNLQFNFEQLKIDHSAMEESLTETQDKLEDTESMLSEMQQNLAEAAAIKEKYMQIQMKYEEMCKEKNTAMTLVGSLKHHLSEANTQTQEISEDKTKLAMVLEEKKYLEGKLHQVSDKLLEATTNFAVLQSQHIRELNKWREGGSNMVELEKFTRLQIDLVDQQRSVRQLQELVQSSEESASNRFKDVQEDHKRQVKQLSEEKEELCRKLKILQELLDNQVEKLKKQFEANEKRNTLVVDLYKENADLMQALYKAEEQKKDAVSRCYKLEDRCKMLRRLLKKLFTNGCCS
ncbi:hypothetical protein CHS0354_017499 [Potamilus streckersoni]|uniref:EF-hand domain-containing protein n=1 Tax=Potamilus streckersoni TaxID=2493646 RepID=A0AAE0TI80_9BIVA|nr:hypothetical protein CHS0354_017499 [Potamilus streckersoni]